MPFHVAEKKTNCCCNCSVRKETSSCKPIYGMTGVYLSQRTDKSSIANIVSVGCFMQHNDTTVQVHKKNIINIKPSFDLNIGRVKKV